MDAVEVLRRSTLCRGALGDDVVDWLLGLKDFEIARSAEAVGSWDAENVSAWEHREYFGRYRRGQYRWGRYRRGRYRWGRY